MKNINVIKYVFWLITIALSQSCQKEKNEIDVLILNELPGKIVFSDDFQIYSVNPNGEHVKQLTTSDRNWDPVWSPNGKITFVKETETKPGTIFLMDDDGDNLLELANPTNSRVFSPSWSPDGQWISFNEIWCLDLKFMHPDSSGLKSISGVEGRSMNWSPDGMKIVYEGCEDSFFDIYVANLDGSNKVNLTKSEQEEGNPVWSPDGSKIAYYKLEDKNYKIYTIDANGENETEITNRGGSSPSWSPDGNYIIFVSILGLHIVEVSTGKLTKIASCNFCGSVSWSS